MLTLEQIYNSKPVKKAMFDLRTPHKHRKCWGTGIAGTRISDKETVICSCALKPISPEHLLERLKVLHDGSLGKNSQ